MRTVSMGVAAALALGACGGDDSGRPIDPGPASGVLGGQPWTYAWGGTDAFLSEDHEDFFAELSSDAAATCDRSGSGDGVLLIVPREPGDYPLSLSRSLTFVVGDDNLIAVDGHLVIDSVTATEVSGGIDARYDDDNAINGRFTLSICD